MPSSLVVRRADGARMPPAKRSVKICRPHRTASQRKRRAIIYELDRPPRQRKVPDPTPVMAMNAARNSPARRTKTKTLRSPDGDNSLVGIAKRSLHNKPGRHQTGAAKCLLHGADSPQ